VIRQTNWWQLGGKKPSLYVTATAVCLEPGRKCNPPLGSQLCYHSAMAKSTYDNIAKPVRKRSAKTGTLVGVRLQSDQLKAIDTRAAKQEPPITRPEAIRGMIDAMLHILAKDPGEKPAKKAKTR